MNRWWTWSAALLALLLGCSDATGPGTGDSDFDPTMDADAATPMDELVTQPSPPVLTPCPEGWREVSDDGLATCDPWPAEGSQACPSGEAQFPGTAGCAQLGVCGGEYGEVPPDAQQVLHVRLGAASGDGSRARPFSSIGDALGRADAGAAIMLGPGTYDEALDLGGDITLVGACATETVLTRAALSEGDAVVRVHGGRTRLRNLRIGDAHGRGILATGTGVRVELLDVALEELADVAMHITDRASLIARRVVVRDLRSGLGLDAGGGALNVQAGAHAELEHVVVERSHDLAIYVTGSGSSAELVDVAVLDTDSREEDGRFGRGLVASDGAAVELLRTVFERNRDVAVQIEHAHTRVDIRDIVVRDTLPARDLGGSAGGRGLNAQFGAAVVLKRAWFENNGVSGLSFSQQGTQADIADAVVRNTRSSPYRQYGRGINVQLGARVEARRIVFDGNRETAVYFGSVGTEGLLEDIVSRRTRVQEVDHRFGRGMAVHMGASVTVNRGLIADNLDVGVITTHGGTELTMNHVVIANTRARPCADSWCSDETFGTNLGVYGASTVRTDRFELREAELCGLQLATGAGIDMNRGVVQGCLVGACVQIDGYDMDRLQVDVAYVENRANLEATNLPLPFEPDDPVGF